MKALPAGDGSGTRHCDGHVYSHAYGAFVGCGPDDGHGSGLGDGYGYCSIYGNGSGAGYLICGDSHRGGFGVGSGFGFNSGALSYPYAIAIIWRQPLGA